MIKNKVVKEISQEKILQSYIRKCIFVVSIGIILFILLLISNNMFSTIATEQIEDTYYLNQLKDGSKTLTIAVSAYAGSGKETYREDYYRELEETKSREKAIEVLKTKRLKDYELAEIDRIIELSNNLIPNEEMAFQMVENGKKEDAKAMIFSSFYRNAVTDINDSTDALIKSTVTRLEKVKDKIRAFQVVVEIFFAGALLWLMLTVIKTIHFAKVEILTPVVKVSEQLMIMAGGDLHQKLDLEENESEVGQMAKAIRVMKQNWSDMIYEIAYSLEEMSKGNYALDFSTEYVGEFITIKECLLEIVEGMKEIIKTISEASKDIDQGASGLAQASESLATACTTQALELSDILLYLHGITETTRANEKDAEEAVKISYLARSTVDLEEERIRRLQQTLDEVTHCIDEMSTILEFTALNDETQTLIENTLKSLNATIESTTQAMDELESIRLGTEETSQRAERIVNNFNEEIENIDKISENMSALASVVDNNSATAEETAAISEQQKSHVSNLVTLIDNFKI